MRNLSIYIFFLLKMYQAQSPYQVKKMLKYSSTTTSLNQLAAPGRLQG